jgi:Helix-turn-helix domain
MRLDDRYLALRRLADYAGLSVRTLRNYLSHPACPLPYYRVGGKILVRQREFDTWMIQFQARSTGVDIDAIVNDVIQGLR